MFTSPSANFVLVGKYDRKAKNLLHGYVNVKELLGMLCNTFVFVSLERTLENFGAVLAAVFDKFAKWLNNMIGAQTNL